MIEHITYYRIEKKNGKVKRHWLNRFYMDDLIATDTLFQQQFGIDPLKEKDIVRAIKITPEQQAINRAAFLKYLDILPEDDRNRITYSAIY